MKFEVSATVAYKAMSASTLILNIQPFRSLNQVVIEETFESDPQLKMRELNSISGEKRFKIIEIPGAGEVNISYKAIVENEFRIIPAEQLDDVPISLMTASALTYLNPSRYCQSDRLYRFAYNKFGHIEHAYQKVMAIRDWIYTNVQYGGYTTAQTSAYDTITEQIGVCRDFAHLGVALCRALTIPARYFTGYAYQLNPPDFHACFEAYLGGHWVVIDATKLAPLNGLVKIATGVDAVDTAFASIFGNLQFVSMNVNTVSLNADFESPDFDTSSQGYSYI
ncbi:transglutaminase-like domain-containing protein [Pedobacter hartonius]|uniref:Transglutaminase-like enzyme, putative cysteine protease n=1 Tax=Pedobacter hartonius TaxID=425514 RepID=A0A1H4GL79_9SPHI|nr:transglutaminase family protein [Pedobacter hartonius]SEB10324.1 Transglutaminase-like enzyme, putative cysteine protease [Pedobacter hartonius]